MPITLTLETEDGISEFAIKPIDRKTYQTVTKKLAVDSQGRECARASMTHDGLILGPGMVADLYEDADGNTAPHGEVIQADDSGNVLRNLPATIGRPQRPIGPVSFASTIPSSWKMRWRMKRTICGTIGRQATSATPSEAGHGEVP